jgi:hypothetical protein
LALEAKPTLPRAVDDLQDASATGSPSGPRPSTWAFGSSHPLGDENVDTAFVGALLRGRPQSDQMVLVVERSEPLEATGKI